MAHALKNEKPERGDSDEQSCQSCRDVGLCPAENNVGGDQKKSPNDRQSDEVAARNRNAMSPSGAIAEHQNSGRCEAKPAHQQRRQMINRQTDGKVCGTPQDVNQRERGDDVQSYGSVGRHGNTPTLAGRPRVSDWQRSVTHASATGSEALPPRFKHESHRALVSSERKRQNQ